MKLSAMNSIPSDFSLTLGKKVEKAKPEIPELREVPGKPGLFMDREDKLMYKPTYINADDTFGGFKAGQSYIICALSSSGKSAIKPT